MQQVHFSILKSKALSKLQMFCLYSNTGIAIPAESPSIDAVYVNRKNFSVSIEIPQTTLAVCSQHNCTYTGGLVGITISAGGGEAVFTYITNIAMQIKL